MAQTLDKSRIDKIIDSVCVAYNRPGSAGVGISVLLDGKVITRKTYGMANLEHDIPFTHDSPVREVYSVTREFMCVGAALMEAQGLLRFDDKVKRFVPTLPEWSKDVTIQDLLNHSSGFADEWALLSLMLGDMRTPIEREQFIRIWSNQPQPAIEPGKGYMYSNSDMAFLRLVMEAAARQSLPDYLKKNVFDPLGMSSTFMDDDIEALIPRLAESYYGTGTVRKGRFYKLSPGGDYRIVSTVSDLEKWFLAVEDTSSWLSKSFQRLYRDARPIPVVSPEKHYVFGHEWHTTDGISYVHHGGVGTSYLFRIPSRRFGVIVFGNAYDAVDHVNAEIAETIFPGPQKAVAPGFPNAAVRLTNEQLAQYTGRYSREETDFDSHLPATVFYDVKLEDDSLWVYFSPNGSISLTPYGDGFFKEMQSNGLFRFTRAHRDSAMQMKVWGPDGKNWTSKKERALPRATANHLRKFTGLYHSAHLDLFYRLILNENGELVIRCATLADQIIETDGSDRFYYKYPNRNVKNMFVKFSRDKKGRIDGFSIQHVRMPHHRFDKVELKEKG